jgi:hypothetical protein
MWTAGSATSVFVMPYLRETQIHTVYGRPVGSQYAHTTWSAQAAAAAARLSHSVIGENGSQEHVDS